MTGSEVATYTSRFNHLAILFPVMVTLEDKKIERYIRGLASLVQGLLTKSRPFTFDSAKKLAYQLIRRCIRQGTMASPVRKNHVGSTQTKFHVKSKGGGGRGGSKHHKPEPEPVIVYVPITNTLTPIQVLC